MDTKVKISATALRLLLGWFMFFDGLGILLNPNFTATGFLTNAKTFQSFYSWFALPMNIGWVDFVTPWAIILIGVSLLIGVGVRMASWAGAFLMIIYYFPHYYFPIVTHGYIVEEHIIYAAVFVLIALWTPAQEFGVSGALRRSFLGRIPFLRSIL